MLLGSAWKERLLRYGVASASALAALLLTWGIWPLAEIGHSPVFFAAVVVSAFYGGLGPGLFATGLAVLAKAYFFVAPTHSFFIEDAVAVLEVAIFAAIAALVSSLTAARRAAEAAWPGDRPTVQVGIGATFVVELPPADPRPVPAPLARTGSVREGRRT